MLMHGRLPSVCKRSHFLSPTTFTPRLALLSAQSMLSNPGYRLINWSSLPSNSDPEPQRAPSLPLTQSQSHHTFKLTDFTTISDLLTNPNILPGTPLEDALNRTGIEPGPLLLRQVFNYFNSSVKPLFTLFRWAEKQPGYQFSVSLFNSMINLLFKARDFDSAWSLVHQKVNADEGPNMDTFTIMIRRYARAGKPLLAIRTFEFASGLDSICHSNTKLNLFENLLDSLCKKGHVKLASEYFDRKKVLEPSWIPSICVFDILLNGLLRSRELKEAERLWLEMKRENVKPSVVTYGTLVEGYCRMRHLDMAMELVDDMRREGIEPNTIVYNPIINALGEARRFKEALGTMEKFSVLESGPTISTYNSLVKSYCKARDLEGASKILKMMISKGFLPTPMTYNYFFKYFSKLGKIEEGLNLYKKIIESGYVPDRLTYHLLVKMLCEQERLGLAMQIVKQMRERGCDLDLATSTKLIHLLCKMHRFEEAFGEFEDMIRRGIIPQYLTYQKFSEELKIQRMNKMAQKLDELMTSVPHSMKLPNTYGQDRDSLRTRRRAIIKKAEAMSDILKTCRDPTELVKRRSTMEKAASSAN